MAQNIFSNCSIITTGCYLYTSVGVVVPNGKYSDGSNVFTVTGGAGLITSSEPCSVATTTSTTTAAATTTSTTTSGAPATTSTTTTSAFNPLLGTWEEHYTDMNAALPEGYYIWKPNTYGTKPLPVIIYFGGLGEQQGSGLSTMLNFGSLPALINNRKFTADAFPYEAIVVMAKIGGSVLFAYNYNGFNPLNRVIQYIKDTYGPTNTDYNKYYLTGYSFGAGVSLLWAGGYSTVLDQYNTFIPNLSSIAAMSMISMAAGGYNTFAGANFKNRGMPMWFLHGDNDTDYPQTLTVNVNGPSGTGWVASLNDPALGTPPTAISPATLMNIGAGGHNVWGAVYDWLYPAGNTWKNAGQDVYQWMLSKSL